MTEQTGKGAYGTRHVMEEEMRACEQGVFEAKSNAGAPENKMADAPEDKADEEQPVKAAKPARKKAAN